MKNNRIMEILEYHYRIGYVHQKNALFNETTRIKSPL